MIASIGEPVVRCAAVPGHLAPETLGIALFLAIAIPVAGELWRRRE